MITREALVDTREPWYRTFILGTRTPRGLVWLPQPACRGGARACPLQITRSRRYRGEAG
jgi:hypothetical protein